MTKLSGFNKNSCFKWLDLGAGAGEVAILMNKMYPNSEGYCIDLHNCPDDLLSISTSVGWHSLDINSSDWASHIKMKFDIVYATAVLEHVLKPVQFMKQIGSVLEGNALVYFINPLYGTFVQRILKKRWPYFTPGEHLNIPSRKGMMRCMQRGFEMHSGHSASVREILLNYPLKYCFARFGMECIAKWVPESCIIPLPAGAVEAVFRNTETTS